MKAAGLIALALVIAAGGWLWMRVGVDVALNAVIAWCA